MSQLVTADQYRDAIAKGWLRQRGTLPLDVVNHAAAHAGPASHGSRTAMHQRCVCVCKLPPVPSAEGSGPHVHARCLECGERLNVDDRGVAYRRWPGDLTTAEMELQRLAVKADLEMRELINTLPLSARQRLARLSRRSPSLFKAEAQRLIADHQQSGPDAKPSARRALQRSLADTIEGK